MLRILVVVLLFLPLPGIAGGKILVYGDSLSAAYGLSQDAGWVALLQERLKQRKLDYSVVNASISGETTSGGVARIGEVLKNHKPGVVIVALGGNDGLRGLPAEQMRSNLAKIVRASQQHRAMVLIIGMRMPPNYGESYARQFRETYSKLAKEYRTALLPFMMEGFADNREMFQNDNIHPTAAAQPIILENVWKSLVPLLKCADGPCRPETRSGS